MTDTVKPLTLRDFRLRLQRSPELFEASEWGGCGCFAGASEAWEDVNG